MRIRPDGCGGRHAIGDGVAPIGAGRSVDVTYRFQVSPGATLSEDYLVFVHAYDRGGTRLWTADHRPTPPTTAWARGSVVEYTQPTTVPRQR